MIIDKKGRKEGRKELYRRREILTFSLYSSSICGALF
jgi:hypothetical protein